MWNKIEQLMIKQGLNQNTLARRMSISTSTLTELKMNRIKKPSFELMCKFADALGVSLDDLRSNE
ncbi:XRE family transcriptional regulator [Latilactobacillus sakei]|nr:helix-turn-helix transcriptional regulator [Latilactobacillus sakei]AUX11448.1 XRE family transcriptional regulator [Latilactobacillus sakei]